MKNTVTKILLEPVIATNVVMKVFLHAGFTFRNEALGINHSVMEVPFGNITAKDNRTFEFTIK